MLMEQTPSQQNWQPYNSLKRPGQMRAQSYQTMAHGADTIQFFQLRRSVGGCEKKDDSATYYYVQMDGSQRVSRVLIDTVEKALGWKVDSSAE